MLGTVLLSAYEFTQKKALSKYFITPPRLGMMYPEDCFYAVYGVYYAKIVYGTVSINFTL